jgi:hypothetical protein
VPPQVSLSALAEVCTSDTDRRPGAPQPAADARCPPGRIRVRTVPSRCGPGATQACTPSAACSAAADLRSHPCCFPGVVQPSRK